MYLLPLPSIEVLNEWFDYNPETGILAWKKSPSRSVKIGKKAGHINNWGYVIVVLDRCKYKAHRLIWKIVYNEDPEEGKYIDHINQVRDDNRICNLRCVSHSENVKNTDGNLGKSGIRHIHTVAKRNRYAVKIGDKHIKTCITLDEAKGVLKRYNDDDMLRIVTMP